jgi:hypothetical protein
LLQRGGGAARVHRGWQLSVAGILIQKGGRRVQCSVLSIDSRRGRRRRSSSRRRRRRRRSRRSRRSRISGHEEQKYWTDMDRTRSNSTLSPSGKPTHPYEHQALSLLGTLGMEMAPCWRSSSLGTICSSSWMHVWTTNEIKLSVTAKTLSDQTGLTQCVVPGVATAASAMTHGRRSFLCLHVHHKHGERMGKG